MKHGFRLIGFAILSAFFQNLDLPARSPWIRVQSVFIRGSLLWWLLRGSVVLKGSMRTFPLLMAIAVGVASGHRARAEIGVLVPAYFYPVAGSPWDDLVDAAGTIPVTAILNPASGPGGAQDSNYVAVVDALRAAGGAVVGYVHSSWGSRPLAFDDIDPFVAGLIDPGDFESTYGVPPSASGDLDQDGDHDFDDIRGFVALLAAGVVAPAVTPVAEPATTLLATVAGALFCGCLLVRRSCSMRRGGRSRMTRIGHADPPTFANPLNHPAPQGYNQD